MVERRRRITEAKALSDGAIRAKQAGRRVGDVRGSASWFGCCDKSAIAEGMSQFGIRWTGREQRKLDVPRWKGEGRRGGEEEEEESIRREEKQSTGGHQALSFDAQGYLCPCFDRRMKGLRWNRLKSPMEMECED